MTRVCPVLKMLIYVMPIYKAHMHYRIVAPWDTAARQTSYKERQQPTTQHMLQSSAKQSHQV